MTKQELILEELIFQKYQRGETVSPDERKLYAGFACARVDAKYGREHNETHLKK